MSKRNFSNTITGIRKDKRKLVVVLLLILIVSGGGIFLAISNMSEILQNDNNGSMNFGEANCFVELTTAPIKSDGSSIYTGIDSNVPLFLGEQEVSSIKVLISILATGSAVDWTTLDIQLEIFANDEVISSYSLPETSLESNALGFQTDLEDSVVLDVDNEWMVLEATADGNGIYPIQIRVVVVATITDANGNLLEDDVAVDNEWQITSLPTGAMSAKAEENTAPVLKSIPTESVIAQGTNHILAWLVEDDNPATYEISTYTLADGWRIVDSGDWISNEPIEYDIGFFISVEPGNTIVSVGLKAIDEDGLQTITTVLITILVPVTDGPTFLKSVGDTEFTHPGLVEAWVTFKPRTTIPSSYFVYANGELIASGSWSGADISVIVDYIYTGTNRIKCVVTDTSGQSASYIHSIFVSELGAIIDPYDPDNFVNAPLNNMQMTQISIGVSGVFVILGAIVYWYSKRR